MSAHCEAWEGNGVTQSLAFRIQTGNHFLSPLQVPHHSSIMENRSKVKPMAPAKAQLTLRWRRCIACLCRTHFIHRGSQFFMDEKIIPIFISVFHRRGNRGTERLNNMYKSHRQNNKRHSRNNDCEKYLWQWICSRS